MDGFHNTESPDPTPFSTLAKPKSPPNRIKIGYNPYLPFQKYLLHVPVHLIRGLPLARRTYHSNLFLLHRSVGDCETHKNDGYDGKQKESLDQGSSETVL